MIIDFHTHIFPDALAPRALAELSERAHIPPHTEGTCSSLLSSMERAGVDRSVVAPVATSPDQVTTINSWAITTSEKYEKLTCFGTLHPEMDNWKLEIERLVKEHFVGVKLHPDYQRFFVDEPRMIPIYKQLADAGMIVLFHAGIDIGLPFPTHCTPDRLANVMREVSGMTIVAAHMGGYRQWDAVDRYLIGHNLFFDTAYSLKSMGAKRMREMILLHGVDKILFGSDSPWDDQKTAISDIQDLNLTEEELAAILGGNAERLLNANL